ncbi:MFS transporter [Georgenia sp. M64]|uniref:MFS transporter n=1 Tax=Georgenia sp. M64 TaxID=3120520 RepID=UPI0030DE4D60
MRRTIRQLQAVTFLSSFDRMLIAPVLPLVAADLGVSVEVAAGAATAYFVGYGVMQVGWGVVSDRFGRVPTVRLALAIAGVLATASFLVPSFALLVLLRGLTGAALAAVVPGALVYLGDAVDAARRHGLLTDVMRAMALGTALAAVVAAVLGDALGWRAALALPGVLALVVVWWTRTMPEPAGVAGGTDRTAFGAVARDGRARALLAVAFVEGALMLGVLPLLPALLQVQGMSVTLSGVVVAGYGVGVVVLARVVKGMSARVGPARLMAAGAVMTVASSLVLALDRSGIGVLVAAVLLAGGWAFFHSTLQNWVTETLPRARATMVSLFATALFVGSAAGTAAASAALGAGAMTGYLVGAAAVMTVLGAAVVRARLRWR